MKRDKQKITFPHIGLRILKSVIAVLCCFFVLLSVPTGRNSVLFSALSTLVHPVTAWQYIKKGGTADNRNRNWLSVWTACAVD